MQVISELFTISQTAEYLNLSTKTVRRLIKSKKIVASLVGRQWRIKLVDIDNYLLSTSNENN